MPVEPKAKSKRRPVKKIEVEIDGIDPWEIMKNTKTEISVAQLVKLNKPFASDVMAGIRHLHGRKKKKNLFNSDPPTSVHNVNSLVTTIDDDDDPDDMDSELTSDQEFSEIDSDIEGSVFSMVEDDYVGERHAYNMKTLRQSTPFTIPVEINGEDLKAVIDTGASVSVISSTLVDKLELAVNKKVKISVENMDQTVTAPGGICESVPVTIGGYIRSDMFVVQERTDDLLILGMPWLKQYDVVAYPSESKVELPIKKNSKTKLAVYGEEVSDNVKLENARVYRTTIKGEERLYWGEEEEKKKAGVNTNDDGGTGGDTNQPIDPMLKLLLANYDTLFVEDAGLGRVQGFEHHINTTSESAITSKPYRMSWEQDSILKKTLDDLLEQGLIRPSEGVWSAPVIFVDKKTGDLRLCQDYRKLNNITVKDSYPLPHIDDIIDSIGDSCVFSTLDAASGFWQIPMAADSINKTGFTTKYGTYEFMVMPFGLTNAPATFQRMMTRILGKLVGHCVHVFIDDIIIYSKNVDEHMDHLASVFDLCIQHGLRLKRKKCVFIQSDVEYLGHQIGQGGLRPNKHNTSKIMKMKVPRNKDDVRSFLGMTGYYRRFVEGYATLMNPITTLTKKDNGFIWGAMQQKAFDIIKATLTSVPVLAFPSKDLVQILTTDASNKGLGTILSQSEDGSSEGETVISYGSRSLKPAESNYSATHLEALAVVWAVNHYKHYLAGRKFVLYTDHAALKYIFNNPQPGAKLARWAAALMEYDYEVRYRPGSKNPADALSRLIDDEIDSLDVCVGDENEL